MADIDRLRIGDTLRIDVEVLNLDRSDEQFPIEIKPKDSETCWIRRTTVEAAEHLPAPKVFKRRDVVRTLYPPDRRGGLVVGPVEDRQFWVWVTWPGNEYSAPIGMPASGLEHDEAPE